MDTQENSHGKVYALDYETHYTRDYSLKILPTKTYVYHDDFDAYLLSVAGNDGLVWVGHPKDFDWPLLDGATVLHHNAQFDALVTERLQRDGVVPKDISPKEIHDTADLAAYLQHPRALKDHAKYVWGLSEIAKKGAEARVRMAELPVEALMDDPEILEYATMDAKLTLRLWEEFSEQWPTEERELSRLNREACFTGIAVDVDYVEAAYSRLAAKLHEAEREIPWDWAGKKTPLSRNKIIQHCKNVDIWYPSSFAKDDPDCRRWETEFSDGHPWVRAIRDWRRVNMLCTKVKHLRDNQIDGIYYPQFKYFGARTGRFSGDGKFNLQNLPRDEMFCDTDENGKDIPGTGCDLRRCFIARPGHKLAMIDYAQVEARALVAVVGDEPMLEKLREGMSIYEAHARATMGWTGGVLKKENPELYRLAKARVLGLGYGCGRKKFALVAKLMAGLDLSEDEAADIVDDFRASNPKIVNLWHRLDKKIRTDAALKKSVSEFNLHSGRTLSYWEPRFRVPANQQSAQLMSMFLRGDKSSYRKSYGGLLTENMIQGLCRDILRDAWVSLDRAGYRVLFSVHDELVVELPEDEDVAGAERCMLDVPEWAQFIPLAVESTVGQHYTK